MKKKWNYHLPFPITVVLPMTTFLTRPLSRVSSSVVSCKNTQTRVFGSDEDAWPSMLQCVWGDPLHDNDGNNDDDKDNGWALRF